MRKWPFNKKLGKSIIKPRRAQSILDFVLVFVALGVLAVGITRIWVWFNANYLKRQVEFQESRKYAATPKDTYPTPFVDIGATPTEPGRIYEPLDLTDQWVFQGEPSGSAVGGGESGVYVSPEELCKDADHCGEDPDCIVEVPGGENEFNADCECFIHCVCLEQIKISVEAYDRQIETLCGTDMICQDCFSAGNRTGVACDLRENAKEMDEAAEECDDPWELCWWGDWGRTPDELRSAARKLRRTATNLEKEGQDLINTRNALIACCNDNDTREAQQTCLTLIATESCPDLIAGYNAMWDGDIADYTAQKTGIEEIRNEIARKLNPHPIGTFAQRESCPWNADQDCREECADRCTAQCTPPDPDNPNCYAICFNDCMVNYYPGCYQEKANYCCQTTCCGGTVGGWGRNCWQPIDDCDNDCFESCTHSCEYTDSDGHVHVDQACVAACCPLCSLEEQNARLLEEIDKINIKINKLQGYKNAIADCCDCPDPGDPAQCRSYQGSCMDSILQQYYEDMEEGE